MKRRELLKLSLASIGGIAVANRAGAQVAEICQDLQTPAQTEGPFYPIDRQVDEDADLVAVQGRFKPAQGKIIFVEGTVIDQNCQPVIGALVEIWQACASGRYNHKADPNPAPLDPNFQYWGKAVTDDKGYYRFRTIVPGAYPADTDWMRPPHIHFKVSRLGFHELITQMYFTGEVYNDKDLILQALSKTDQDRVVVELKDQDGLEHPVAHFPIQIRKV